MLNLLTRKFINKKCISKIRNFDGIIHYSSESIANVIIEAIKNKEEMSKKSLERYKLYTMENFSKKMINVYKSII
jgi:glycosyltransferase involved in cell wall biosynthesis